MMGGSIGIDSREGQGSTFWFTCLFERALPGQRLAPEPEPVTPILHHEEARILVAEDNATNRLVVLAQLKKLGYNAVAVNNGSEAVEALGNAVWDLILMDCQMPVMDGYEATRQIRKSGHPDIPIIALTASAMRTDQDRCLAAGMNDYLSKPVDLVGLGDSLTKWLPLQSLAK
jgi:CheY-like chemotaxis protein